MEASVISYKKKKNLDETQINYQGLTIKTKKMNRSISKTLEKPMKLYSNLKFDETKVTSLKAGNIVTLEETGKVHMDEGGTERKVFRIRKNTRNYYVLEELSEA
jgi:membrane peptidoglycan carboxypeptidase